MAPQPQLTPTLAALRDQLLALERADGAALAAALAAPITFDDVRGFVRFDDDSYVRALIFRDERLELRLHCWRPGQSTSLHGHGASACAFKILRGTATETVLGDRDRVWAPGSIVEENAPRLHQVMNAGRDPLLTLHAYSPPLPVDAPSSRTGRQVVIVGGGFAGAAVAYHLLREMDGDGRIHLVEMGPWLGRGDRLRRRERGLSTERPGVAHEHRSGGAGRLREVLGQRSGAARVPGARAVRAVRHGARRRRASRPARRRCGCGATRRSAITRDAVVLRGGATLPADVVILATGIVPRVKHAHPRFHPRVVDAWDECALATLPLGKEGRLLLLGSGLSALDVLAFLDAQGFAGEVTLVSPRGLLPLSHEPEFQGTAPAVGRRRRARAEGASPAGALGARDDCVGGGRRDALAARGRQPAAARHPPLPVTAGGAIAAASSATFDLTGTCFATAPRRTLSRASATGRATAGCDGSPAG